MMAYSTGHSFKHYFMIVIPLLIIGCALLLKPRFYNHHTRWWILILLPLFALHDMVLPGALRCAGKLAIECFNIAPPERIEKFQKQEKAILNTLERTVPNNERDNIYVHNYWEIL